MKSHQEGLAENQWAEIQSQPQPQPHPQPQPQPQQQQLQDTHASLHSPLVKDGVLDYHHMRRSSAARPSSAVATLVSAGDNTETRGSGGETRSTQSSIENNETVPKSNNHPTPHWTQTEENHSVRLMKRPRLLSQISTLTNVTTEQPPAIQTDSLLSSFSNKRPTSQYLSTYAAESHGKESLASRYLQQQQQQSNSTNRSDDGLFMSSGWAGTASTTASPFNVSTTAANASTASATAKAAAYYFNRDEHRDFVQAIYEVGMKHASPSVIVENMMTLKHQHGGGGGGSGEGGENIVTGERLKSHLQKYRKNRDKSKLEFLAEYDKWLEQAYSVESVGSGSGSAVSPTETMIPPIIPSLTSMSSENSVPPHQVLEILGTYPLLGGDVPAFITYSIIHDDYAQRLHSTVDHLCALEENYSFSLSNPYSAGTGRWRSPSTHACNATEQSHLMLVGELQSSPDQHQILRYPLLSIEERDSPLGVSLLSVLGLFRPIFRLLLQAREQEHASSQCNNSNNLTATQLSMPSFSTATSIIDNVTTTSEGG